MAVRLTTIAAVVICLGACTPAVGGSVVATTPAQRSMATASRALPSRTQPSRALPGETGPASPRQGPRVLPRVLYGVTVDDVGSLGEILASSRHLPKMPITRIYFDVTRPVGYYERAVRELRPGSYLMGELLDSSDEARIGTAAFGKRVSSFLAAYGGQIDVWEIGNEVNGSWTGRYQTVAAKLITAYREVSASHGGTALTLYYDSGCGGGPGELNAIGFTRAFVPPTVRNGLTYVFLSYYEGDCNGIRPSARTWTAYFEALHALYPHSRLGFGEVGLDNPVTSKTMDRARSMIAYYYGLPIHLPYYVGGYFWWYYAEDCLPYATKPMWRALRAGFEAEAASQR